MATFQQSLKTTTEIRNNCTLDRDHSLAGVLPTKSVPDAVLTWPEEPGLQGLVWNMTTMFEITSTVFYSPVTPGKKSKNVFMFHHGQCSMGVLWSVCE
jgi:hypothetical protein